MAEEPTDLFDMGASYEKTSCSLIFLKYFKFPGKNKTDKISFKILWFKKDLWKKTFSFWIVYKVRIALYGSITGATIELGIEQFDGHTLGSQPQTFKVYNSNNPTGKKSPIPFMYLHSSGFHTQIRLEGYEILYHDKQRHREVLQNGFYLSGYTREFYSRE